MSELLEKVRTLPSTNVKVATVMSLIKLTIYIYLGLAVMAQVAQLIGRQVEVWTPDVEVLGLLALLTGDSTLQFYAKRKTFMPGGPQDDAADSSA